MSNERGQVLIQRSRYVSRSVPANHDAVLEAVDFAVQAGCKAHIRCILMKREDTGEWRPAVLRVDLVNGTLPRGKLHRLYGECVQVSVGEIDGKEFRALLALSLEGRALQLPFPAPTSNLENLGHDEVWERTWLSSQQAAKEGWADRACERWSVDIPNQAPKASGPFRPQEGRCFGELGRLFEFAARFRVGNWDTCGWRKQTHLIIRSDAPKLSAFLRPGRLAVQVVGDAGGAFSLEVEGNAFPAKTQLVDVADDATQVKAMLLQGSRVVDESSCSCIPEPNSEHPMLPDGSLVPEKEYAVLLRCFGPWTGLSGDHRDIETMWKWMIQHSVSETERGTTLRVLNELVREGFIEEVDPSMPHANGLLLRGQPQPGERRFLATDAGRRAAMILSAPHFAHWRLGHSRLQDQALLGFLSQEEASRSRIAEMCPTAAPEEVAVVIEQLISEGYIRGKQHAYRLLPPGTARRKQAAADFQKLISQPQANRANDEFQEGERMSEDPTSPDPKKVFVIHGRNMKALDEMDTFLRACGLSPINFGELRSKMGGTPSVAEIVDRGMREAKAVVAIFTGDEFSALRPQFRTGHDKEHDKLRWQARANVIFEAGMAFGKDRRRVVFVAFGTVELFTDIAGIHYLRPNKDAGSDRLTLKETLRNMGCAVAEGDNAWMRKGDFESCTSSLEEVEPRDPFDRARDTSPSKSGVAEPQRAPVSEDGLEKLLWLRDAYVEAGFPNHKVWSFTPGDPNDPPFNELRALGLVALRGPYGGPWLLTDRGVEWIMRNRNLEKAQAAIPMAEPRGETSRK